MRLFGLISTVDVISEIRDSRLGDDNARAVAGSLCQLEAYAASSRSPAPLTKRLGCFVVRTDGKAIEESAAETLPTSRCTQEARARRAARRALKSSSLGTRLFGVANLGAGSFKYSKKYLEIMPHKW